MKPLIILDRDGVINHESDDFIKSVTPALGETLSPMPNDTDRKASKPVS